MNPLTFISPGLQVYARIAAMLLLVALGAVTGWTVNGWRLASDLQALHAEHAQTVTDAAKASLAAQKKAEADHALLAGQLATVDSTYQAQLTKAQHENETLRADVAAGRRVVHIAATCPGRAADVPQAASGGSVDPGAGAVLDAQAGQAVLDLRADAIRVDRKLAACQAAVRCMTGQGACPAADPPSN